MATKKQPKAPAKKVGRPSSFRPEFVEQARKLCLLGATDKDLADFFGVAASTINKWKGDHPEFSESLKAGKAEVDAEVERSLFERATGYRHEAVKFHVIDGAVVETPYTEHYPPDTTAMIFWLKNRKPDQWRDKQDIDVTVTDRAAALKAARERAKRG